MTNATATTISHTTEHDIFAGIEVEFADYRSRIALLAVEAIGTLTDMFTPLGPVAEVPVIDIEAIEWDSFDLAALIDDQDAVIMEFAAA